MLANFPHNTITGLTDNEDYKVFVEVHVQSEFFPIDEAALTQVIQQWMLDSVPEVVATTAERREQVFPVTQLPSLPS